MGKNYSSFRIRICNTVVPIPYIVYFTFLVGLDLSLSSTRRHPEVEWLYVDWDVDVDVDVEGDMEGKLMEDRAIQAMGPVLLRLSRLPESTRYWQVQ
jgi:hypothetical protein